MKITTQKDLDLLEVRIKNDLGIDISKYRNDEVAESFAELILFPKYVFLWGVRPIIGSLVIFIIVYLCINLDSFFESLVFIIFGLPLALICGVLFAGVFLIRKMKSDIGGIMEYTIEILKEAISDISELNQNMKATEKKESIKLLYLGIMHVVTIPSITSAIKKSHRIVGYPLSWLIRKIFVSLANAVTMEDLEKSVKTSYAKRNQTYEQEVKEGAIIHKNVLQKIVDIAISTIEFPFKFLFVINLMFFIILTYILN